MRKILLLLPLLLSATPAFAQDASPAIQLPRELTDPEAAMKLAARLQALSSAVMSVRVGEVKAAIEGRQARPEERDMTLGDLIRRKDPNFDRDVAREVAIVGPKVQHGVKALNRALPEIVSDVNDVQKSLERVVANLPDPTYPQR